MFYVTTNDLRPNNVILLNTAVFKIKHMLFFRSSRLEACLKTSALKNFAKFMGKHLCQESLF